MLEQKEPAIIIQDPVDSNRPLHFSSSFTQPQERLKTIRESLPPEIAHIRRQLVALYGQQQIFDATALSMVDDEDTRVREGLPRLERARKYYEEFAEDIVPSRDFKTNGETTLRLRAGELYVQDVASAVDYFSGNGGRRNVFSDLQEEELRLRRQWMRFYGG